jgi:hypothetical protein
MSQPEYVATEDAGRETGVRARTLRHWAEAGTVPVVASQRSPGATLAGMMAKGARRVMSDEQEDPNEWRQMIPGAVAGAARSGA